MTISGHFIDEFIQKHLSIDGLVLWYANRWNPALSREIHQVIHSIESCSFPSIYFLNNLKITDLYKDKGSKSLLKAVWKTDDSYMRDLQTHRSKLNWQRHGSNRKKDKQTISSTPMRSTVEVKVISSNMCRRNHELVDCQVLFVSDG